MPNNNNVISQLYDPVIVEDDETKNDDFVSEDNADRVPTDEQEEDQNVDTKEQEEGDPIELEENDDEVLFSILEQHNVDPENIVFEGEEGRPLSELTDEEKMWLFANLAVNEQEELDPYEMIGLSESQVNQFKQMLENGEFQEPTSYPELQINSMEDDEVYFLDLKNRFGDKFSDEQIWDRVENDKENNPYFKDEVEALRENYKNLELQQIENKKNEEYQNDVAEIYNTINSMDNVLNLPFEEEKEQIFKDLAVKDESGYTNFEKEVLTNPQKMAEAMYAIRYIPELLQEIDNTYNEEINQEVERRFQERMNQIKGQYPTEPISAGGNVDKPEETKSKSKSTLTGNRGPSNISQLYT